MSVYVGPTPDTALTKTAYLTVNVQQAAATYDLATVSGGPILVTLAIPYVGAAVTTLTSVAIQTNTTTVVQILSAVNGAVANLTADKTMAPFTTQFVIQSGKKIQFTIVGATTAVGTMFLAVSYQPLAAGASLA